MIRKMIRRLIGDTSWKVCDTSWVIDNSPWMIGDSSGTLATITPFQNLKGTQNAKVWILFTVRHLQQMDENIKTTNVFDIDDEKNYENT